MSAYHRLKTVLLVSIVASPMLSPHCLMQWRLKLYISLIGSYFISVRMPTKLPSGLVVIQESVNTLVQNSENSLQTCTALTVGRKRMSITAVFVRFNRSSCAIKISSSEISEAPDIERVTAFRKLVFPVLFCPISRLNKPKSRESDSMERYSDRKSVV